MAETKSVKVTIDAAAVQATPLTFVNHAMAHSTPNELVLTLFQIAPPPMISEQEFAALTSAQANCVARLAMTWGSAVAFLEIVAKSIQEHHAMLQAQAEAESRMADKTE